MPNTICSSVLSSSVSELEFSFAGDTSGVLSALGVNTFFAGHDATDIAINDLMIADPGYIAASLSGLSGDNANVTQMLGFQFTRQPGLSGMSVEEFYRSTVTALAVTSAAAQDRRDATLTVHSSLKSQREALSGVSLDEEAVKLIAYQTGFQAAARFITTVQELLQVLLAM